MGKYTDAERRSRRRHIEASLTPGGAVQVFEDRRTGTVGKRNEGWFTYALLSSISSAIRERAADQCRSTERSDKANASAVSAMVSPAK